MEQFDINETKLDILERCPEWADLMNVIEFRNEPGDTAAYGEKTVSYNGRKMAQVSEGARAFLIARQLMHIQLAHRQRGQGKDPAMWNAACDAVVNELLASDGFELPPNVRRRLDAGGISAEEMYDILYEEADEGPQDAEEGESAENESEETVYVLQEEDRPRQAGDMQGAQLRDIEDPGLAQAVAGLSDLMEPSLQMDFDWFPADRIRDGILIEQFKPYPVPHAEILLDTSASIDEDLLRAFVRGVRDLLREDAVIKVGCFDTDRLTIFIAQRSTCSRAKC